MKLNKILLAGLVLCSCFTSCDSVDMEDRFDGPIVTESEKNILIEEFTGQKCSNCPLAHEEIKRLQGAYGNSKVIAVAIHGGPQAVDDSNTNVKGLANETGKEYNRRLGSFSYPKGMVDRAGGLLDFEKWNSAIVSRFSVKPKVELEILDITANSETHQLSLRCKAKGLNDINGNLQLWLTESNIVAIQTLPAAWGGGHDADYVHNHVFRAAINGIDGEQLSINKSDEIIQEYSFSLNEGWNTDNLSVVAFFHNEAEGVIQVIDKHLNNSKQ